MFLDYSIMRRHKVGKLQTEFRANCVHNVNFGKYKMLCVLRLCLFHSFSNSTLSWSSSCLSIRHTSIFVFRICSRDAFVMHSPYIRESCGPFLLSNANCNVSLHCRLWALWPLICLWSLAAFGVIFMPCFRGFY